MLCRVEMERDRWEEEAADAAGSGLAAVQAGPGCGAEAQGPVLNPSAPNAGQKHPARQASPASSRNARNAEAR